MIYLTPLIIIISTYIGFYLSNKLKQRTALLESCITMVNKISVLIEFDNIKTISLFSKLMEYSCLDKLDFIDKCNFNLKNNCNFKEAYLTAIQQSNCNLLKEDFDILKDIADILGNMDSIEAINNLKLLSISLQDNLNNAKSKYSTNQKLYKSLGFLCGLAICILII
ncbi:MAG: stage III sporulation protein AB [Oscillospiraceae bacterium]